jgi:hypothetical protein
MKQATAAHLVLRHWAQAGRLLGGVSGRLRKNLRGLKAARWYHILWSEPTEFILCYGVTQHLSCCWRVSVPRPRSSRLRQAFVLHTCVTKWVSRREKWVKVG